MNGLKWPALCAALWLAGCASSPEPVRDSGAVVLTPSAELKRPPPAAAVPKPVRERPAQDATAPASLPGTSPQAYLDADQQASSRAIASLSPPIDLWERIRRGYGMPDLDNSLVHDREQWYSNRPDYIFRMTERSKKYLFHIVEELELRNMPTELALLPFVESAFNPQAVSGAKAAGMWQFMPATGRSFELKQV